MAINKASLGAAEVKHGATAYFDARVLHDDGVQALPALALARALVKLELLHTLKQALYFLCCTVIIGKFFTGEPVGLGLQVAVGSVLEQELDDFEVHLELDRVQGHGHAAETHEEGLPVVEVVDVCSIFHQHLCYTQTYVLVLIDISGFSHAGEAIEERSVAHGVLMVGVSPILHQQLHKFQVASHAGST